MVHGCPSSDALAVWGPNGSPAAATAGADLRTEPGGLQATPK